MTRTHKRKHTEYQNQRGSIACSPAQRLIPEFDATLPVTHAAGRDYADEDDPLLTAFVTGIWDELHSRETTPVPPCPACASGNTRVQNRPNRHHALPFFRCRACKRTYSRLTGTPLARLRFASKMPAFIRLLSQPIPLEEASRRLRVEYMALSNWLMRFRELIAQHDPDGRWTSRVRLGVKYQPTGTCPHCGYSGQLRNGGFGPDTRRCALCPHCSRTWSIAPGVEGADITVRVVKDLALTAVARRTRAGQVAPALASAEHAILKIPARAAPASVTAPSVPAPHANRFDFSQPLRANSPLPRRHIEDRELTAFLADEIGKVFSQNIEPPACPHCEGVNTHLSSRPRTPTALPTFQCRTCTRYFTRATRTPMANMLRRDMLFSFLPWLSQHRPLTHAAAQFNTSPEIVKAWVKRFRQWLIVLDPSGHREQRVKLGLKAPWPVLACPHCHQEAPAMPHGFKRTRTQSAQMLKRRLFRCTLCTRFFDVPVKEQRNI
ncbi:transposase-like protein [Paraburkholderia sp. BL8N3]|nr:DUF746 domain-containing protein [Paraburkholderia sp. BL8N3]TCK32030.1 transposase-like protein [Paraburkholderia sp. BL8N3]